MKTRLRLDAEIDLLNKGELDDALDRSSSWEREAAFGLRHQDLPRMIGTPSGGTLNLGADQPEGTWCGPKEGWYWAVSRISVDGLASGDAVKVYKDTKFVGWITYQPGMATFGIRELVLKPGDFLRVTGSGLTATGQVEMYGECVSVPGPLMWKVLS
jgi:hypothetical protein